MHSNTKKRKKFFIYIVLALIGLKLGAGLLHLSPVFFQLLFNKNIELKKTGDQRVNVLLLGIGGGTHEGPDLTDTIIFVSIDPGKNRTTLISIPRDLWITDLQEKINTAYALGEEKNRGSGLLVTEATVAKLLNQPITYGIRINFNGFVRAVDLVDGLDITVKNMFDDYHYPIEGKEDDSCGHPSDELQMLATASAQIQFEQLSCRYVSIHFDKGTQHMDGKQALQYVRSRHAEGVEGTDFARSKRQQEVLSALKEKLISAQTILNPSKVLNLYSVIKDSIDTDIKEDEYDDFIKLAQKMKHATMRSGVLDIGDDQANRPGLLVNPPITSDYNLEWVLIPKEGKENFKQIQSYVNCMIQQDVCDFFGGKKTQ